MRVSVNLFLLVLVFLVALVRAGPLEDGIAAAETGNYKKAYKLLRPSAEKGNVKAQIRLIDTYRFGWGVPQDYAETAKWSRKAAE